MQHTPTFSIIIPVLHEEHLLQTCIDAIFRQFHDASLELIVVDGDPQGSSIQDIAHPRVITTCSQPGRGRQLNAGAQLARGRILVFLHVDTRLPDGALSYIDAILAQDRYVAGAFKLGLQSDKWVFKFIEMTASWRYRLTRLPYGDQAFFMTREYFFQIGGYQNIPIMEDLELMRRIKRRKERVHISATKAVQTSVRRWQKEGILYAVLRSWLLASLFCLGVSPQKLVTYYRHYEEEV